MRTEKMICNLAKSVSQGGASNASTDNDDVSVGKMIGFAFLVNNGVTRQAITCSIRRICPSFHNKIIQGKEPQVIQGDQA